MGHAEGEMGQCEIAVADMTGFLADLCNRRTLGQYPKGLPLVERRYSA